MEADADAQTKHNKNKTLYTLSSTGIIRKLLVISEEYVLLWSLSLNIKFRHIKGTEKEEIYTFIKLARMWHFAHAHPFRLPRTLKVEGITPGMYIISERLVLVAIIKGQTVRPR